MRTASIDFVHKRGQPTIGWALLAIGLALLAWSTQAAWKHQQQVLQQQRQVQLRTQAELAAAQSAASAQPEPRPAFFEDKRWQRAVRELTFPWVGSLMAVEHTVKPPVYLLALRSAPESGQIGLEAEAPDLDASLAFVSKLQAEPKLTDAALITHEESADSSGRVSVHFSVQTRWVPQP